MSEASVLLVWIAPFLFVAIICNSFFYIGNWCYAQRQIIYKADMFLKVLLNCYQV